MRINKQDKKLFIYGKEFTASTTMQSMLGIEGIGKLALIVDNNDWKTLSFVPNDIELDGALATNFVFYKQKIRTINIVPKDSDMPEELFRNIFLQLTGLNINQTYIPMNWGNIEYCLDIKNMYYSIIVNFTLPL